MNDYMKCMINNNYFLAGNVLLGGSISLYIASELADKPSLATAGLISFGLGIFLEGSSGIEKTIESIEKTRDTSDNSSSAKRSIGYTQTVDNGLDDFYSHFKG